jgi:hypothetical protein
MAIAQSATCGQNGSITLSQENPMTISMYAVSVPTFKRMLTNLGVILTKAEQYAAGRKIDPAVLVNARLYPDMFPLVRQVQIATDQAKGCPARLAGIEIPKFEDNEASFADLQARIAKTLAFIDSVRPDQIDGSENRDIELLVAGTTYRFKGQAYLIEWALPNFYFHVTTAYAILRHNGLDIGKKDFLGG